MELIYELMLCYSFFQLATATVIHLLVCLMLHCMILLVVAVIASIVLIIQLALTAVSVLLDIIHRLMSQYLL